MTDSALLTDKQKLWRDILRQAAPLTLVPKGAACGSGPLYACSDPAYVTQFALVTGSALLTDKQRLWRDILRQAASMKAQRLKKRPVDRFRIRVSLLPRS